MFRPCLESLCDRIVPAAHFLYANSSLLADGSLVVEFKEAGLGNKDELVPISLTGTAEATYQWFNKGGNKPQGQPFSSEQAIDVTEFFQSRNGHVTGTFTIAAPAPPEEFLTHPHAANWVAMFTVSYTDIACVDVENGVSTAPDFFLDQELTTPIPIVVD